MKMSKAVKPISYLKQHTADAVREVNENSSAMVITQNGEAKAVLVDIVEYEQSQESFALLKILAQSKESYLQGNHKPARKALADVRKQLKDRGY
ncbi:MAG TPA: type II toxin-antitoxin system Phd/YefM family antitoxin [Gammaproteobacteria bacterium]|nr:type II toxin-antitoxin system Phd/YefM family antitoxin [Gammaproteobacteria bacterium]